MASRGLRTFGFLLLSGAIGGFCLSSGAAHYFPPSTDRPGGGGGGQDSGGGSESGKTASQHGGSEQNGKGAPASAAAGTASGGKAPEKTGPVEDGADDASPPSATVLTENEIVGFLAGNTIERTDPNHETLHRYMSRRGWQGDTDADGHLVAHRWIVRDSQLCQIGGDMSVACAAVKIDRESKPGKELGARLGTITADGGPAWPVLRGNVAQVPEVMPLINGVRLLRKGPVPATASAKGDAAFKALIGHPLVLDAREGEPVSGVYYDPDGRWVTTQPLAAGAKTGLGGIRVSIGQWSIREGVLCLDEPGLVLTRKCYAAEQMGEAAFRLVPGQKGPILALSEIAEGS